jgi:hypothetical protein
MDTGTAPAARRIGRRAFLTRGALAVGALGAAPALLAACGTDERDSSAQVTSGEDEPRAVVGDVLDFALRSDEWPGDFGFVTFRLHPGSTGSGNVWFIRTDASEESFSRASGLVWAPKLAALDDAARAGELFQFADGATGQASVMSSEPGRPDYTPAWRVRVVRWRAAPTVLRSRGEIAEAERAGRVEVERSGVVVNAPVVAWPGGALPVDDALEEYLGAGQLVEPPDTRMRRVTFKLHECFPGSRYIATDTALGAMADGMSIAHSPRLQRASAARATGRTNVFMNGVAGSGPMGFQHSVFDSRAGDPRWSPYWDHMTYEWLGNDARVLETESEIHAARDAGRLREYPGTPDTGGRTFTVNCPVPVVAPNG